MRADEFIRIGPPTFMHKPTSFSGVGKEQNVTIGKFHAELAVDDNSYAITVHVISNELSTHGLLQEKIFSISLN